MYCRHCGSQVPDGAVFCPKCGGAQDKGIAQDNGIQQEPETVLPVEPGMGENIQAPEKKKLPVPAIAGIAVAAVSVILAVVAAVVFLPGRGDDPDGEQAGDGGITENAEEETPLYHIEDVAAVDVTAQNYTPGEKQPGMAWDRSLFYALEDVDTTSSEDGRIADCKLTKTLLRDAQSGELIQYEIYSDPSDEAVCKIVSIEGTDSGLKLTDYYYQDGQPNFMFTREDTVYTPTYATIEKVGERYYFDSDVMVRWRMIREPGEVGEYTLAPEEVWYSQADYFAESDEIKGYYDDTELRTLNEAHNTYDAIAGGESIGMVQGILKDTAGNGISGKAIDVRRASDDVLLYRAVTDEDGEYTFFVYLNEDECYMKAEADETYKETVVQDVCFTPASAIYTYAMTLHKLGGDEYPVAFRLYSCMDVASDENGTVLGEAAGTASATIREGAGNRDGEALMTVETADGELTTELPSGIYTVQFHTEGYLDSYVEVEVMEEAVSEDIYVMPGLAEGQTGVLLTWEGEEVDLDLTLFTPDQAEGGDMAHIGGGVAQDGKGNILVSDNSSRCEVLFINSDIPGSYKLYVNDYTDSLAGSYTSDALYRVNVHIYIFHSDGLVAEYTVPVGQNGVVWEVAEINGKNITPAQRVYSEISGKNWWIQDKSVWLEEEDARLKEVLDDPESDLRNLLDVFLLDYTRDYSSEETLRALLRGEKEGIEDFLRIGNGVTGSAQRLNYVYGNQPENWDELCLKLDRYTGTYYFLTKEQADYLLSSVCGKQIDYNFPAYKEWMEPYIAMWAVGDPGDVWNFLDNISVERTGANMWKVRGYHFSGNGSMPATVSSQVCFTVIRNPDSCFDGYSVTDFVVEKRADDADWAKKYYDYLTKDPEGIALIENGYGSGWSEGEFGYGLVYVDDDMIPELYLHGPDVPSGDSLLFLNSNGVPTEVMFAYGGSLGGGGGYIQYTGLMENYYWHMGLWVRSLYRLEKGQLIEISSRDGHFSNIDPETGDLIELAPGEEIVEIVDSCQLDGKEVTKEQYEEAMNAYVGTGKFQSCASAQYIDVLEMLNGIIQGYY